MVYYLLKYSLNICKPLNQLVNMSILKLDTACGLVSSGNHYNCTYKFVTTVKLYCAVRMNKCRATRSNLTVIKLRL